MLPEYCVGENGRSQCKRCPQTLGDASPMFNLQGSCYGQAWPMAVALTHTHPFVQWSPSSPGPPVQPSPTPPRQGRPPHVGGGTGRRARTSDWRSDKTRQIHQSGVWMALRWGRALSYADCRAARGAPHGGARDMFHLDPDDTCPTCVEEATPTTIMTTFYDLIAAIHAVVEPDAADLAVPVLVHLLESGRITFLGDVEELNRWASEPSPERLTV